MKKHTAQREAATGAKKAAATDIAQQLELKPGQSLELLKALQTGDVYLAGGIVMIQAILVVIGILLSDIALAFLDPRIRYSGGGR